MANLSRKINNFGCVSSTRIRSPVANRGRGKATEWGKRRSMVWAVEPVRMRALQRRFIQNMKEIPTRASLQVGAPNGILTEVARVQLDVEIVFEEVGMGSIAEESLTKMHENGNLKNGIGIQIYQFDLIEVEKIAKKVTGREPEPMLDELLEDHHFAFLRGWG